MTFGATVKYFFVLNQAKHLMILKDSQESQGFLNS